MTLIGSQKSEKPVLEMKQELALQTRLARKIINEINRNAIPDGFQLQVDDAIREFRNTKPRTRTPSLQYNCFGLTFAARRANIASDQLAMIREDDEYQEVAKNDVLPGDIVLYTSKAGEIIHAGIVISEQQAVVGPWVVSKWGEMHEAVHLLYDCPYRNSNVAYFRIST